MAERPERILRKVRGQLGPDRLAGAIVYLGAEPLRAGERLEVGDVALEAPWDGRVAFVDLEPGVNWGHDCRYLVVRDAGDDVIERAAKMPPFLKPGGAKFHLLWRGPRAPAWAVETGPD